MILNDTILRQLKRAEVNYEEYIDGCCGSRPWTFDEFAFNMYGIDRKIAQAYFWRNQE